jgi:hypothetical protein
MTDTYNEQAKRFSNVRDTALRIVNDTGRVVDTHVYTPQGEELKCITKIEFEPLTSGGGIIKAKLTVFVRVDIMASADTVEAKPQSVPSS